MRTNGTSEFALPLSLLREEVAASELLPSAYAKYRRLLADALRFFLERLSAVRLRAIFSEQLTLGASASTAARVVALLHHVPALHKLGQVVARDRRLHPDFRKRLQQLESLRPRTGLGDILPLIKGETKRVPEGTLQLGREPLAEGSVAVIMPFTWLIRGRLPREGVFKLLKPGIRSLLEQDLEVLGRLGDFLDEDCERYHLPALDYRDTFETIRELLLHEVRLEEEQRNLAQAADLYRSTAGIKIPELLPFSTPRLTAMERMDGEKIAEPRIPPPAQPETLARTILSGLIIHPLFSTRPAALFHADPHAGNLLATPEGRVGILDWSLTGHLSKANRITLVQLMLGAFLQDVPRLEEPIVQLARRAPDGPALRMVLCSSLRSLRWGKFPGLAWLIDLLDQVVLRARVQLDGNLLLFRKSLLTLEGVLRDVTGDDESEARALLDESLVAGFLKHWMAEWPERFYTRWNSRAFATHLSTTDLMAVLWSSPRAITRWWTELGLDILGDFETAARPLRAS